MGEKNLTRLADRGIEFMQPMLKTEILIHQLNVNLDVKISFGKSIKQSCFLDPEIRKMLIRGFL